MKPRPYLFGHRGYSEHYRASSRPNPNKKTKVTVSCGCLGVVVVLSYAVFCVSCGCLVACGFSCLLSVSWRVVSRRLVRVTPLALFTILAENTLLSFQEGLNAGANANELDCGTTKVFWSWSFFVFSCLSCALVCRGVFLFFFSFLSLFLLFLSFSSSLVSCCCSLFLSSLSLTRTRTRTSSVFVLSCLVCPILSCLCFFSGLQG
jgi:hypothetical protein